MRPSPAFRLSPFILASLFALFAHPALAMATTRSTSVFMVDASNLRQVGQASLIYATDNNDQLPRASNLHDYAALLAHGGGLNDAAIWSSDADPANPGNHTLSTVMEQHRRLDSNGIPVMTSSFKALKPTFAVPLGELHVLMPSTTPIGWTRGLQPDGTWSADSPYGTQGGHIVFLGGNVQFFRNLTDGGGQLVRFSDGARTANILEALPPGTTIGEYIPTTAEKSLWSRQPRPRIGGNRGLGIPPLVGGLMLLTIAIFGVSLVLLLRREKQETGE
ncbi:hypothetical protein OpiT1DRAFT_02514 [Opitutaceae bacterium TAV1]|nr:hypothetical protein OpiT1DRAFT_02514 [Opitutaceae bacterium TAV1]